MTIADRQSGSAAINGELWGAKARDWAEFQQRKRRPDFEECIRSTGIGQGTTVLDVGCGAGGFCRLAADAGASVTGIDAAAGMIEVARERVPDARFDVGDIQFLPYDDQSFDVVAGFHSFPFTAQPLEALRQGSRCRWRRRAGAAKNAIRTPLSIIRNLEIACLAGIFDHGRAWVRTRDLSRVKPTEAAAQCRRLSPRAAFTAEFATQWDELMLFAAG
jgi:SAM-dependent methyltransferase